MGLILSPSAQRGTPLFVSSHRAGLTWVMEKFLCIPRLIPRGDRYRHLLFCLVCFSLLILFLCEDNVRQFEKCGVCSVISLKLATAAHRDQPNFTSTCQTASAFEPKASHVVFPHKKQWGVALHLSPGLFKIHFFDECLRTTSAHVYTEVVSVSQSQSRNEQWGTKSTFCEEKSSPTASLQGTSTNVNQICQI